MRAHTQTHTPPHTHTGVYLHVHEHTQILLTPETFITFLCISFYSGPEQNSSKVERGQSKWTRFFTTSLRVLLLLSRDNRRRSLKPCRQNIACWEETSSGRVIHGSFIPAFGAKFDSHVSQRGLTNNFLNADTTRTCRWPLMQHADQYQSNPIKAMKLSCKCVKPHCWFWSFRGILWPVSFNKHYVWKSVYYSSNPKGCSVPMARM